MKKLLILLAVCGLGVTACGPGNNPKPDENNLMDLTLAEWASVAGGKPIFIEATLGGKPIEGFNLERGFVSFEAVSETEVFLNAYLPIGTGEPGSEEAESINLSIEKNIPVKGNMDKISIDATLPADVTIWKGYNGQGYANELTVRGEARRVKVSAHEFRYEGEYRFECQYKEGYAGSSIPVQPLIITVKTVSEDMYQPHPGTLPEKSLIESITFNGIYHSITGVTGTLDGKKLTGGPNYRGEMGMITIEKVRGSETEVTMDLVVELGKYNAEGEWNEVPGEDWGIELPHITVSGNPYDAKFEETIVETEIRILNAAGISYDRFPATATVSGRMKGTGVAVEMNEDEGVPYVLPKWEIDIHVIVEWTDDTDTRHTLDFHVDKIDSFGFIMVD